MSDEPQLRVFYLYLGQDDPKKATMKKLERLGLARKVDYARCSRSLSLSPYAEVYLTRGDSSIYRRKGICAVDGSWNRISSIKDYVNSLSRKLPLIVPANPVNFGKPGKLSSVEAVSAALAIMGFSSGAVTLMSKFNWGPNFLEMNRNLLADYSECETQEEVIQVQNDYF